MKKILLGLVLCSSVGIAFADDVYKVTVSRRDSNLYQVDGQGIYIKTRYCYEYAYSEEAILRIDSFSGYNIGKIIFKNGTSCDVEKILK